MNLHTSRLTQRTPASFIALIKAGTPHGTGDEDARRSSQPGGMKPDRRIGRLLPNSQKVNRKGWPA